MHPSGDKQTARWMAVALAVLALFWIIGSRRVSLTPAERAPLATSLRMVDASSQSFSLSDYRGRVVLLSLWADWCPPCRRETPALSRLEQELGPQGLSVVGLNADSLDSETLARIATAWRIEYRIGSAAGAELGEYAGPGSVPHHWFIDREGRIRGEKSGAIPMRALRRTLSSLLDEGSDAAP